MSRAGRTLSFLFGGNQNMHQGKKGFHIPQLNQRFDPYEVMEKELSDILIFPFFFLTNTGFANQSGW